MSSDNKVSISVLELMFSNGEEMSDELDDWFVQQDISILRPHEVQVVPAVVGDLPDSNKLHEREGGREGMSHDLTRTEATKLGSCPAMFSTSTGVASQSLFPLRVELGVRQQSSCDYQK